MASKTIKQDNHYEVYGDYVWQDYNGTGWNNLKNVYYSDNASTQCYPNNTKPKSLFFHISKSFSTNYNVKTLSFIVNIKSSTSKIAYPSLKVFVGDTNAPYKKSPVFKVAKPTKVTDGINGYKHLHYTITNVSLANLKNLNVELDWSKSNGSTEIRVGYGRLNVYLVKKTPSNITFTSTISPNPITDSQQVTWTITAKQNGDSGSGTYTLGNLYDFEVLNIIGSNSEYSNNSWKVSLKKGETAKLIVTLKPYSFGVYELQLLSGSSKVHSNYVTVNPSDVTTGVQYLFTGENYVGDEGYFEVMINGEASELLREYTLTSFDPNDDDVLIKPLYDEAIVLSDSFNISENKLLDVHETGSHSPYGSNDVAFNLESQGKYYLHLQVPFKSIVVGLIRVVTTTPQGNEVEGVFNIQPQPSWVWDVEPSTTQYHLTDRVSVNIGTPNVWTIRCKSSRRNYFSIYDGELDTTIEQPVAFIGNVKVDRCHSSDVTANVKNSLIRNRYQNRAYYGKQGDFTESISMKLRIPPKDVATLEGFCEFDKPVPIDLIPTREDGDPLNHRGWAELYEVNNIKKVNSRLYDCEPVVEYITHELNTKFSAVQESEVYPNNTDSATYPPIKTFMTQTHNYGDPLEDFFGDEETSQSGIFDVTPTGISSDMESEDGYANVYEIPSSNKALYQSVESLSNYGNYDIRFRNTLETDDSEDHDNNWEMSVRLVDRDNEDKVLFEHHYHNFKHLNRDKTPLNQCDVIDTLWNGSQYETINSENMSLNIDELAPLIGTNKGKTHFHLINDTSFSDGDDRKLQLELLYNKDGSNNIRAVNQLVTLTLVDEFGLYVESWEKLTDNLGRVYLDMTYQNGNYHLTCDFTETDELISAYQTYDLTIDYTGTPTAFLFEDYDPFTVIDDTFDLRIGYYNSNDVFVGLSGVEVGYCFGEFSRNGFTGVQYVTSTTGGVLNIPVVYNNGTKRIKLIFKGNATYLPIMSTQEIVINIPNNYYTIEADDITYSIFESEKVYSFITKRNGSIIPNLPVKCLIYKDDETFTKEVTTDENGKGSFNLQLSIGLWKVDIISSVSEDYEPIKPNVVTHNISINDKTKLNTYIVPNTTALDSSKSLSSKNGLYNITLKDEHNNVLPNELIQFEYGGEFFNVLTNSNGVAYCPLYTEEEDMIIITHYKGSVNYNGCDNSVRVSCASARGSTTMPYNLVSAEIVSTHRMVLINGNSASDPNLNGVEVIVSIVPTSNSDLVQTWYGTLHNESVVGSSTIRNAFTLPSLKSGSYKIHLSFRDNTNTYKGIFRTYPLTIPTNATDIVNYKVNSTSHQIEADRLSYIGYNLTQNTISPSTQNTGVDVSNQLVELVYKDASNNNHSLYSLTDANGQVLFEHDSGMSRQTNATLKVHNNYLSNADISVTLPTATSHTLTDTTISISGFVSSQIYQKPLITCSEGVNQVKLILINQTSRERVEYLFDIDDNHQVKPNIIMTRGTWTYKVVGLGDSTHSDCIVEGIFNVTSLQTLLNSLPVNPQNEIIITPQPIDNLNGKTYGSDIRIELRDGIFNFYDYGMLMNSDVATGSKISLQGKSLVSANVGLEFEVSYNNSLNERLNNLEGLVQVRCMENKDINPSTISKYQGMVCSPSVVKDSVCYFTRHSEDGTLYYYRANDIEVSSNGLVGTKNGVQYIGNPYNQYKGGCDLQTTNGISLFGLDNGFSPIVLSNGLIRCKFHKHSGYVVLERYCENINDYHTCNVLKLDNLPPLELESYSDDKIVLKFGKTEWTMWRGHPYVQVKHSEDNFRILEETDRIYCETINEQTLGYLEEEDIYCGVFTPYRTTQLLRREWRIGENISSENFRAYDTNGDVSEEAELSQVWESSINDYALNIQSSEEVSVLFPTESNFLEKPSSEFTVLLGQVNGTPVDEVMVRGFSIASKMDKDIIYTDTVSVGVDGRATFSNVPSEVQYIDFTLIFNDSSINSTIGQIMVYDGDGEYAYEKDLSQVGLERSTIEFDKTYYANLYNKEDEYGLCIIRPHRTPFNLRYITPSELTIFAPYLKKDIDENKPSNLLIEYIYSHDQTLKVDWEQ